MELINHAKRELEEQNLFSKDCYDGMIGKAVMELIEVFSKQDHSGFSAGMTRDLFMQLANFKTLSPMSNNPEHWNEVGPDVWQSNRQASIFSTDGGKTYYDIDKNRTDIITSKKYEPKKENKEIPKNPEIEE